jgi:hypothetical protein
MTVTDTPTRLLRASARRSYDPDVDIDWAATPDDDLWWMQPERTSLFGTDLWHGLSPQQQRELVKHETASIVHMGWWFEVLLMQGLLKEVYAGDPRDPRVQFLLTEIGDECRHSTMFGRAMETAGAASYGPPPLVRRLAGVGGFVLRGPTLYAGALLVEETLDRWQRESMDDERLQPLTRMVNRIHVTEEARHVTFARDELARAMPRLSRAERRWHQLMTAQNAYVAMRCLVNPQVYASVGLDPAEARKAAMHNPEYRATIGWMGEKVMPFLTEQGLVSDRDRKIWRGSFLLKGPATA